VERRLNGLGVPVIALLAEARLETLHRLAQQPPGTRVGVVAAAVETAHGLEHSIAAAALPNIVRIETCPAEEGALRRLVRRADLIVCSTSAADRVRQFIDPTVPVIVDDRALNQRAVQMLGAILTQPSGERQTATPPPARDAPRVSVRPDRRQRARQRPGRHSAAQDRATLRRSRRPRSTSC
jgi:hypothetical protein